MLFLKRKWIIAAGLILTVTLVTGYSFSTVSLADEDSEGTVTLAEDDEDTTDESGDTADSAGDESDDETGDTTYDDSDIEALKKKYSEIKSSKEDASSLLALFQNEKSDIIKYLNDMDSRSAELEADIDSLTRQKDEITSYLNTVSAQLGKDKAVEAVQYRSMKLRIKYMYEHGGDTFFDALAGSTSLGDMLNKASLTSRIQKYDNNLLKDYRKTLDDISKKEELISEKEQELVQVVVDLEQEQSDIKEMTADKKTALKNVQDNISSFQDAIKSFEQAEKEQESLIEAAEASAEEGTGEYADLPSEYSGGKFAWPVPGHYTISSPFGYRTHPIFGTRMLHGGIDISVPSGTSVYAGADGVVSIAEYSSSAGNYIMINHGGGFSTVYMHNSKLLVKVGDQVKRGQRIALSGSTGWSTGPHCHFGVRKDGKYVNPVPYLKGESEEGETDYSDEGDTTDETPSEDSGNVTRTQDDGNTYTTEADDQGDKKKKSDTIKDDSDPDSE